METGETYTTANMHERAHTSASAYTDIGPPTIERRHSLPFSSPRPFTWFSNDRGLLPLYDAYHSKSWVTGRVRLLPLLPAPVRVMDAFERVLERWEVYEVRERTGAGEGDGRGAWGCLFRAQET